MCSDAHKIDMMTLIDCLGSADQASIEQMREKINKNAELKKDIASEVGKHFLSCIALSEIFNLELDTLMNNSSPEELASFLGMNEAFACADECDDDDCCDDDDEEDEDCCETC